MVDVAPNSNMFNQNWFQPTPDFGGLAGIGAAAAPTAVGGLVAPPATVTPPPNTNPNALGGANNNAATPIGMNVGTGQLGVGGLSALGNLWTAWNATELAKKSFDFNKQLSSDNYTNQSQAYNTNLQNIATSRGAMENQSQGQVQNYIAGNSVKTTV